MKRVVLLLLTSYSIDPNLDLILANGGHKLGVNGSFEKRILTGRPDYSNAFGNDPELGRMAKAMKGFLSNYKNSNALTVAQWIELKNIAASAVQGNCESADKLFEMRVIPSIEYDRLMKRCGREGIERAVQGDLQVMRAREMAGDDVAHAELQHLRKHELENEMNGKHSGYNHGNGSGDLVTPHLDHGMHALESGSKSSLDTLYDNPAIKRDAMGLLGKNLDGVRAKLAVSNTPFAHNALDRLNKTQHAAEDVVAGVAGAGEQFLEMQDSNRDFSEKYLGHSGIDGELRGALNSDMNDEVIPPRHLNVHNEHHMDEDSMIAEAAARGIIDPHDAAHAMNDLNAAQAMKEIEYAHEMMAHPHNAAQLEDEQLAREMMAYPHKAAQLENEQLAHEMMTSPHNSAHLEDGHLAHDAAAADHNAMMHDIHPISPASAARANDLAHKVASSAIKGGASDGEADMAAQQARVMGIEYDKGMASNAAKADAGAAALDIAEHNSGYGVPEIAVKEFLKQYGFSAEDEGNMKGKVANLSHNAPLDSLHHANMGIHKEKEAVLERAIEEVDSRMQVAKEKEAEANAKIREAEHKIKDAELSAEAKHIAEEKKRRIQDQENEKTSLERKQVEALAEKKKRYESSLLKNQPKNIKFANSLKDLEDIEKDYKEKLFSNQNIVEQERNIKEEAIAAAQAKEIVHEPVKELTTAEINTKDELSTEKKNARIVEEALAREAEEKEIHDAREIAVLNVKRLGGSDEEAGVEGDKAEILKRKEIKMKKQDMAAEIKKKLEKQTDTTRAIGEAEHIANAHSGKNAMGNSILEIEDHEKNVQMGQELKEFEKNQPSNDKYKVIKLISDNVSQISVDNSVLELPIKGIPDAKAKNEEEEKIKEKLAELRDELRNKVTLDNYSSGLVTIKGVEGYLNLQEGCKEIEIKKGYIYFDQGGYNEMVSQKIDVTPLNAVYATGSESLYYKAEIKDMRMQLPSPLNSNASKLLYNDFENIYFGYGKRIEIVNGVVLCEPFSSFSSRAMRPMVYKGVDIGQDQVPNENIERFTKISSEKDGLKGAEVTVMKNPDGTLVTEIKPVYGVKSKLDLGEAVKKAKELSRKKPMPKERVELNINAENRTDFTSDFINSVEKELKGNKTYEKIFNEKNPINNSISGRISSVRNQPTIEELMENYKRTGNNEETKSFNNLVQNTPKIAEKLKMKERDFLENLSKVDNKTITDILKFFFEVSGSLDYHKELAHMDNQAFFKKLKEYFPQQNTSNVVDEFFNAFSAVTRLPNKLNGTPITSMVTEQINRNTCCEPKSTKCVLKCDLSSQTTPKPLKNNISAKIVPYRIEPLHRPLVTRSPENVILIDQVNPQAILDAKNAKQNPLGICKKGQTSGCLLLGQPPIIPKGANPIRFGFNLAMNAQKIRLPQKQAPHPSPVAQKGGYFMKDPCSRGYFQQPMPNNYCDKVNSN